MDKKVNEFQIEFHKKIQAADDRVEAKKASHIDYECRT